MADSYRVLNILQPGTSNTVVYSPGTGKQAIIKNITAVNVGANTEALVFYINGNDAGHEWGESMTLAPSGSDGASMEWDGTIALSNTDVLYAKTTDATSVTIIVSGDEVS